MMPLLKPVSMSFRLKGPHATRRDIVELLVRKETGSGGQQTGSFLRPQIVGRPIHKVRIIILGDDSGSEE